MRAVIMTEYGGPEVMRVEDIAEPEMGAGDVMVDVRAAALNPIDFKIRNGDMKQAMKFDMPLTMGFEMAGVVREVGSDVTKFKPGDEVYARVAGSRIGCFSECIAVDESVVALKPPSLSFEEAASLPLAGLTAWQCLTDRMNVSQGQKVLIHAGAGGVGTLAIQFAKHLGAYVATTASPRNHEFLKDLGADEVIDYTAEDFTEKCSDYDAVLDTMGGTVLEKCFQVVKPGGWVVSITSMPDPETAVEMGMPLPVRLILRLMTRKVRGLARKAGVNYRFLFMNPNSEDLEGFNKLIAAGKLKPIIDKVYPLDEAVHAMNYLELGHARGKVVLKVRG
ncbi:MAG: NADP-dependent oxidoreductase [Candidatus Hydrogenedentes bacterium]|nr:NADP-dependent oxidoreductase [Candidatus Hydrogenedentota bacterium]